VYHRLTNIINKNDQDHDATQAPLRIARRRGKKRPPVTNRALVDWGGSVGDDGSVELWRVRQTCPSSTRPLRIRVRSSAPPPPRPRPRPPPLRIGQSPQTKHGSPYIYPQTGIFLLLVKSEEHGRGAAEPPAARTVPVFIQGSLSILMEGMPRRSSTARSSICGGKPICKRRRPNSQFLNLPEVC
jgi:hypothetical protein